MTEQPAASTQPPRSSAREYLRAAWPPAAIALATIVVVCSTINHYGLTYDEGWYLSRSARARKWTGMLVFDPGFALSDAGIERYWAAEAKRGGQVLTEEQPGAVKLVGGLLGYPVGRLFGVAFPERAGTALFFAGCLVALYLFMHGVWGRAAAGFAVAALALMPRVFADAHLCALDVPVASMMLVTVPSMFAAVRRDSPLLAALSGLAWGVALSCKINALFVPFILGVWLLIFHRRFLLYAAPSLLLGGPIGFFLTWPWLWHHPVPRLAAYLAFHLGHYPVAVSYFGHVSAQQPWHYPIVMTAITTPPLTLGLGAVGLGFAAARMRGPATGEGDWRRSQAALILLGAFFTIAFNCLPSAPKYTGVRLFLPFFPFVAALAGVGFSEIATRLCARLPARPGALLSPIRLKALLAALALLPALRVVAATHPFQMSYYNLLIGGLRGAEARGMEATYWGDTYMAACKTLTPLLRPRDVVWVDVPGCQWIVEEYLARSCPGLRFGSGGWPGSEATWAIVQNKASEFSPASRALMATGQGALAAELDGVPLSLVFGHNAIMRAREHMPPEQEGETP